jgi:outer membrane lipoprotein LolB
MPFAFAKPFFLKAFCVLLVLLLVTIAGCASLPETPVTQAPQFTVQGKLGVREGSDSFSSSFSWAQDAEGYRIELWGPLGQGRTRLVGDAEKITVYAANGDVHTESDSAEAMERWFGFALPIDALPQWIRGHAALEFAIDDLERDDDGDLAALEQLGWSLAFSGYRDLADGHRVPGRIVALRADVRVTLVPKEWSFSSTFQ